MGQFPHTQTTEVELSALRIGDLVLYQDGPDESVICKVGVEWSGAAPTYWLNHPEKGVIPLEKGTKVHKITENSQEAAPAGQKKRGWKPWGK